MPEAVIVSAIRTPVGRAYKGSLRATRPDDLAALAIKEALARVPGLDAKQIDDVILGCAMPEGEQGMNVARIAALRAGLPVETSAMTINRFCSSGLQAIALAAERIRAGSAEVIVAGGTESMSMVPMGGNKISPNPWLVDHYPDAYINMGLGTENIARKFRITREQADQFSADSHKKALAAIAAGNFKDETIPVEVKITSMPNGNGASPKPKSPVKPKTQTLIFATDELHRAQRGLRRATPCRHPASRSGRFARQSERRRHRPRSPPRLHRRQAHRHPHPRTPAPQSKIRHGDDVHRRRHGRRRHLRAPLT